MLNKVERFFFEKSIFSFNYYFFLKDIIYILKELNMRLQSGNQRVHTKKMSGGRLQKPNKSSNIAKLTKSFDSILGKKPTKKVKLLRLNL